MRGKKIDPEFVSQFIAQCVSQGLTTPEEMIKVAKSKLQIIDDKIKEVEQLKLNRSKLLDVIYTFDKPESKENEARLLPFFELAYPKLCKRLCDLLKEGPVLTSIILECDLDDNVYFCLKQLLEYKIASHYSNTHIMRGEKFDDYIKFVLRETE